MKQRVIRLSAILLLAALVLPSIGPLVDHHFAERQPGHIHALGAVQPHTHAYEDAHSHHRHNAGYNSGSPILVNHEGSLALVPIVADADVIETFLSFEPTSYFLLPSMADKMARLRYVPPPRDPPRFLI